MLSTHWRPAAIYRHGPRTVVLSDTLHRMAVPSGRILQIGNGSKRGFVIPYRGGQYLQPRLVYVVNTP